jgi:hypothetical protein
MKSLVRISLVLAGFLFFSSDVFSQSKFALSATVAPFYAHTKGSVEVTVPDPNNSGDFISQMWKSKSSSNGFWLGFNGRYSFSQKWSASTGLWYAYSRIKTSTFSSRSYNFSIPVIANFQTSEKKLSPYFSAGALWNFGTTSHVRFPDLGTVTFKSDRNRSRISPMVGAGVIYHFAQRLSFIAQPTFSYAIPPSGVDIHAYQWGLNMQLLFKL